MQISPHSPSSCLFLCFTPPLFSAAAARGRPGGHLLLVVDAHASRPSFRRPLPLALEPLTPCHAPLPKAAAATSPSRWRARCRAPETYLACALEPGTTPHSIPLVPTLFRRLHIPEHPHRPLNAGEQRLTAEPRFHSCSARAYPDFSTARTSRISLTSSRRPSSTRTLAVELRRSP